MPGGRATGAGGGTVQGTGRTTTAAGDGAARSVTYPAAADVDVGLVVMEEAAIGRVSDAGVCPMTPLRTVVCPITGGTACERAGRTAGTERRGIATFRARTSVEDPVTAPAQKTSSGAVVGMTCTVAEVEGKAPDETGAVVGRDGGGDTTIGTASVSRATTATVGGAGTVAVDKTAAVLYGMANPAGGPGDVVQDGTTGRAGCLVTAAVTAAGTTSAPGGDVVVPAATGASVVREATGRTRVSAAVVDKVGAATASDIAEPAASMGTEGTVTAAADVSAQASCNAGTTPIDAGPTTATPASAPGAVPAAARTVVAASTVSDATAVAVRVPPVAATRRTTAVATAGAQVAGEGVVAVRGATAAMAGGALTADGTAEARASCPVTAAPAAGGKSTAGGKATMGGAATATTGGAATVLGDMATAGVAAPVAGGRTTTARGDAAADATGAAPATTFLMIPTGATTPVRGRAATTAGFTVTAPGAVLSATKRPAPSARVPADGMSLIG